MSDNYQTNSEASFSRNSVYLFNICNWEQQVQAIQSQHKVSSTLAIYILENVPVLEKITGWVIPGRS